MVHRQDYDLGRGKGGADLHMKAGDPTSEDANLSRMEPAPEPDVSNKKSDGKPPRTDYAIRPTPKTLQEARDRLEQFPVLGRALQVTAEKAVDVGALMRDMVTPMAGGSDKARTRAKDYANTMRLD